MRKPGCDAPAERVSDDNGRPGLEGARRVPRFARGRWRRVETLASRLWEVTAWLRGFATDLGPGRARHRDR